MNAVNTWPEPETVLSRLEQIRLAPLRSHPDLWAGDADESQIRPIPAHVETWLTERYAGHSLRESAWSDTSIDMTAPGCTDTAAKAAPGPQLNIYPRANRSLIGRMLRAFLRGR